MSENRQYAHSGDHGWQYLEDHLEGVSRRCAEHAARLGLGMAGALIGLLHDLGKSSERFQTYLKSFHPDSPIPPQHHLRGKINHATAGAQCILHHLPGADRLKSAAGQVAHMLALCVLSHHTGLVDCLSPDGEDKLKQRLDADELHAHAEEAWRTVPPAIRAQAEHLLESPALIAEGKQVLAKVHAKQTPGDRLVQFGLLVRMLFSCLIDADRTDTADFEKPQSARHRRDGNYVSWDQLVDRLDRALAAMPAEGDVNLRRRLVSDECFAAAARPRGIYTLTVPTGGGKTLAALRFALEHARRSKVREESAGERAFDRIFFVSPYISIVDQNAAVARAILEPDGTDYASVVLEHHSNLVEEDCDESRIDHWRRRVLAENWDAPVVFTTMVQVLDALFGAGTRPVRRLHALANAVIVFDEVQTLPIKLVHLFNNAINLLSNHCGSTVVLCTATQPLLQDVNQAKGAAALSNPAELITDVRNTFTNFRRYVAYDRTSQPSGWTQAQVAALACEEASTYTSCLVVVNTKKDAREIYRMCREQLHDAHIVHLSTAMCPAHRTAMLDELRGKLAVESPDLPIVCVSTQLIEAGVDIDFACVIRDLAGLDSIAQAAGRCNRHGRRSAPGRVHIVKLPEPGEKLDEIRKGRKLAGEIFHLWKKDHGDAPFPLDDPEQMNAYYRRAFFQLENEMTYVIDNEKAGRADTLLSLLGENSVSLSNTKHTTAPVERMYLHQSFATANESFELMEKTRGIVVPYRDGKGEEIVAQLVASDDLGAEWQLLRSAQPYTVSVFDMQFRNLSTSGAIYEVSEGAGVYALRPEFYNNDFGLSDEAGTMETLNA